ncbi:uncharacterized protein LOC131332652 [Rhododendron vialii]|uniref:uncharacterized protein LOC131332652 n=1 Tax=Rhododendron vialii TaxID=182163 RepID=UPI00265F3859|nr:uncharacterized protein LOC131332652 [Rhododendron vialii]
MIKIASWNIRGLNSPRKQMEIKKFIHTSRLSLIGIVETKVRQENLAVVMQKCLPSGWEFLHNIGSSSVARIIVAWDKQGPSVSLLSTSDQMMLLSVTMEMKTFVISIVYGFNQAGNRKKLWDDLRTSYSLVGHQPWILMGDLLISMLRAGCEHCYSRLDRAVVNAQWQNIFTESEAVVLTPGVSDHCPLTVSILPYKGGMKAFNDIQKRVLAANEELVHIQSRCAHAPGDPILMEYEKLSLLHYNGLSLAEESWSRQKSRIRWLNLGDNNTKFFHKKVASHRMRNKIISICDAGVTPEEVKVAIFAINGDKSPGPEGYNASFFQKNWTVVGDEILASRLQPVLPHIINKGQAAFVKGRSISDNILLMQELVRNYQRDSGPDRCAIKIDLMKAYDSVDWDFLFEVMVALNFPSKFISWVRICITSAMYSIVIDGELEGFFKGEKGLRQGDPIAPYLFLLIMEGLYAILQKKISEGQFNYHPKCSALSISYLAFADDLFLMAGTDCHSIAILKEALDDFYYSSGLKPNLLKSQIFFSGVNPAVKTDILSILPIPEGSLL